MYFSPLMVVKSIASFTPSVKILEAFAFRLLFLTASVNLNSDAANLPITELPPSAAALNPDFATALIPPPAIPLKLVAESTSNIPAFKRIPLLSLPPLSSIDLTTSFPVPTKGF
jgi:hypothetical protein